MPRYNQAFQLAVNDAILTFPGITAAFNGLPFPVLSIPLSITTSDEPIRQSKVTEVNTIPTTDYSNWSDGTSNCIFFGGTDPLETSIEGHLYTPTTVVKDALTNQQYLQVRPTIDGSSTGTPFDGVTAQPGQPSNIVMPNLTGYTYGDVIWAFLEGKISRPGPSNFLRIDPAAYTNAFGNCYLNPIIVEFACSRVPGNVAKETFTMKIALET